MELSPTICRHWYIGDGSISNKKSLVLTLFTNCFTPEEVDFLVRKLSKFKARRNIALKGQYTIRILGRYVFKFIDYISSCPVDSYAYKWDTGCYALYTKRCMCGNIFEFCSIREDRKKYCSKKCRLEAKKRREYRR